MAITRRETKNSVRYDVQLRWHRFAGKPNRTRHFSLPDHQAHGKFRRQDRRQ